MGGGKAPATAAPATQAVAEVPEAEPVPTVEQEAEPVAKAVRGEEARKLRNRRGAAGTILTSPLGASGADETLLG